MKGVLGKVLGEAGRTLKEAAQWQRLRHTPFGLVPILVLSASALVSNFDSQIFTLVLPDIVQDLDLSVVGILTVINLAAFPLVFAVLGLGYVMDRVPRVPFAAGGTLVSGVASLLTTTARSAYPLGAYRLSDSIADNAAGVPEFSLVNDYYPPTDRGRAWALYGTVARIGGFIAPLGIALLAINYGWRTPFYITGPLLIVLGLVMFAVLREPVRGYVERRAGGASEEEASTAEPPVSFGEAWRTIWGIRTLRRLFIADAIGGRAGSRIFGFVFVFFLFEEYGYDVLQRGRIFAVIAAFTLVGGFVGGGVVDILMSRRPQRVLVFNGVLGIVLAASVAVIATRPPVGVLIAILGAYGFALALTGPARSVFYGAIIPAHVRTMGGAVFALTVIPAAIAAQVIINQQAQWGWSGLLLAASPFLLAGAIVDISAAGLFPRDMRSAIASQMATLEYKQRLAAGGVKLLVCRDIDVEYDGVQVLFGVDFDVEEGEIVALLGTNGAGKSTLLKAISGVQQASGGAVLYDGRDSTHVPPYEIAGRGIVHMPGGRGVFGDLTVRENLTLGQWSRNGSGPDDGRLQALGVDEVLEILPALRGKLEARAGDLSGGEQQMVSLAQAFLQRPRLLLIDELSLGLAPAVVAELLEAVRAINRRGVTVVVVEQSVNVALTIAGRAVFMEKGEVRFSGPTKDLLRRPDILRAVYVKGTGATVSRPSKRRVRAPDDDRRVLLSVEGLTKSFGGVSAVDDVTFALHDDECLGLIGPNGAGKTTIFDLVSGYLKPDSGRVVFDGTDVTGMGPDERARLHVIRRFQDARLFGALTVYETILLALDRSLDVRSTALIAVQAPPARRAERRVRRRADQVIELLGLEAYRDKFTKELSTGLRRITDLACVLATEPRVLLLDEPSSGIAQAEAESLGPLLRRVRRETGSSVLIIEHDMPLISRVADELLALDQGRVVLRGSPDEVLNDQRVVDSYLGTSEAAIRRSGVQV